jgi:beta-lactamase class A
MAETERRMDERSSTDLASRISEIAESASAESVGVAFYDYETEIGFSYHGDVWFHAASTIKVPVLVTVFAAIEDGRFSSDSRLHVRNRFISIANEQSYSLTTSRDANSAVHRAIGKTMKVEELAFHMITTSSNLATNLLLDLVGLEYAQNALATLGIDGVELKRGVEDNAAYDEGINNRVTANGLLNLFRMIEEKKAVSATASEKMMEILHGQEFRSGIPAGVPEDVRSTGAKFAHKTGEISTVAHDAGVVFLPKRKPYALAILTGWDPDQGGRHDTLARISREIYRMLTGTQAN